MGHALINGIDLNADCAVASTVSHDSHNIVCVGSSKGAILRAIGAMVESGGGYACVNGKRKDVLPLPIAGLVTDAPVEVLLADLKRFREAVVRAGGNEGFDMMMTMSFMSLAVVPSLKLTDKGLFDVDAFRFVE